MIKHKHFRKDVIMARVIFLAICVLAIAGIVWLVSLFIGPGKNSDTSESNSSEYTGDSEPESESYSESESESESEIMSGPDTPAPTEEPTKRYIKVTSNKNLNLREEPNTTCAVLTSLPTGTKAELLEELDGWYKIDYKGRVGYVSSDYAVIVEE